MIDTKSFIESAKDAFYHRQAPFISSLLTPRTYFFPQIYDLYFFSPAIFTKLVLRRRYLSSERMLRGILIFLRTTRNSQSFEYAIRDIKRWRIPFSLFQRARVRGAKRISAAQLLNRGGTDEQQRNTRKLRGVRGSRGRRARARARLDNTAKFFRGIGHRFSDATNGTVIGRQFHRNELKASRARVPRKRGPIGKHSLKLSANFCRRN